MKGQPSKSSRVASALLLALTLLLAAPRPALPAGAVSGPLTGFVSRIVEADTIVVEIRGSRQIVRLIGTDTLEVVDPRKPVQDFGEEAAGYTKTRLTGTTVRLELDPANKSVQHRDRLGRLLAHVWVKGSLFNQDIIRDGYALANVKHPFRPDYMKLFRAAEREARDAGRGLWGRQKAAVQKFSSQKK